jgi:hypothetical protein
MADLSVNKTDTAHLWEDISQNMIPNNGFEFAPTFVAATNTNQRWIDGNAAGSTTDDSHFWAVSNLAGTATAQFDSSDFHGGASSLKMSLGATSSTLECDITRVSTTILRYGVPVQASTAYKITYWMKINVTSGSSRGAYLRVKEYSSTGAAGTTHDGTFVGTTTGWTQYTISFTSAATCAFFTFACTLSGTVAPATLVADSWFDDIVLQQTTPYNNLDLTVGPQVTPGIQNISGPKIWG